MSTTGPAPNVFLVDEPSAAEGLSRQAASVPKRPVPRAYVVLAALGWLAAGFSFWHQSIGREPPPTPPAAAHGEERETTKTEVDATQQKLATAQSALAATTRLRDEGAEALQEVRERTAAANKELAAARNELDDIRQKIAAQASELATITRRLNTARLSESQGKKQADAGSRRIPTKTPVAAATAVSPPTPAPNTAPPLAATTDLERSAAASKDLAAARGELDDIRRKIAARSAELAAITNRLDAARSQESQAKKQADASSTATAAIRPARVPPVEDAPNSLDRQTPPIAAAKPSLEPPDPTPAPDRKSRKLTEEERSSAVIGPGAASRPSDFELRSGRISRTP